MYNIFLRRDHKVPLEARRRLWDTFIAADTVTRDIFIASDSAVEHLLYFVWVTSV